MSLLIRGLTVCQKSEEYGYKMFCMERIFFERRSCLEISEFICLFDAISTFSNPFFFHSDALYFFDESYMIPVEVENQ